MANPTPPKAVSSGRQATMKSDPSKGQSTGYDQWQSNPNQDNTDAVSYSGTSYSETIPPSK